MSSWFLIKFLKGKWCRDNFRRRGNWEHPINQRYLRDVFHVVVTSLIFILMFFEFIPASPQVDTFCIKFFTLHENLTSFSSPRLLWRSREELSMLVSAKWSGKLECANIYDRKMNVLMREMQHFHTVIIKCVTQPKKRYKFHNWIFLHLIIHICSQSIKALIIFCGNLIWTWNSLNNKISGIIIISRC